MSLRSVARAAVAFAAMWLALIIGGTAYGKTPHIEELSLDSYTADTPTGLTIKLSDMAYNQGDAGWDYNYFDHLKFKLPKGFRVNSDYKAVSCTEEDAPGNVEGWKGSTIASLDDDCDSDTIVGYATAYSTPDLMSDFTGPIYLIDQPKGKPLKMRAYIEGWGIIPWVGMTVNLKLTVDDNFRITADAHLPADDAIWAAFEGMKIHLSDKLIRTPLECGNYTAHARFYSVYNDDEYVSSKDVAIDKGCSKTYQPPSFNLSSKLDPSDAAGHGTLGLDISRNGSTNSNPFSSMKVTLPPGLTANIFAASASCSYDGVKKGTCDEDSKIGKGSFKVSVFDNYKLKLEGDIVKAYEKPVGYGAGQALQRIYIATELPAISTGKYLVLPADIHFGEDTNYRIYTESDDVPTEFQIDEISIEQYGTLDSGNAFNYNPAQCNSGQVEVELGQDDKIAWADLGPWKKSSTALTATGCGKEKPSFNPTVDWKLQNDQPGGTSQHTLTVSLPEDSGQMKEMEIAFPKGFTINSLKAAKKNTTVATVQAWSPMLQPGSPPFSGQLKLDTDANQVNLSNNKPLRATVELKGDYNGVPVKVPLEAELMVDKDYRVVATVKNIPQLPFSQVEVTLWGDWLRNPYYCSTYSIDAKFTTHNSKMPAKSVSDWQQITGSKAECDNAAEGGVVKNPTLSSPSQSFTAGSHPKLKVKTGLSSNDHTPVKRFKLTFPKGFVGNPNATKSFCSAAQADNDNCPAGSKAGTAKIKAQVFSDHPLLEVPATVYASYADGGVQARYQIVAKPGEIMGNEVIRLKADVKLTKETGYQVVVDTDGIPPEIDIREIEMSLDGDTVGAAQNKHLLTAPTQCDVDSFTSTFVAAAWKSYGAVIDGSSGSFGKEYSSKQCDKLGFQPALKWKFGYQGEKLKTASSPASVVTVSMGYGQAHMKDTKIWLPKGFKLNSEALLSKCSLQQADAWPWFEGMCPIQTKIGKAEVSSPLLKDGEKLQGPVHMIYTPEGEPMKARMFLKGLTDLNIDMTMRVVMKDGAFQIETSVNDAPQLPFSEIKVTLYDGLITLPNTCNVSDTGIDYEKARPTFEFTSHSGKTSTIPPAPAIKIEDGCDIELDAPKPRVRVDALHKQEVEGGKKLLKPLTKAGTSPDELKVTVTRCMPLAWFDDPKTDEPYEKEWIEQLGEKPCSASDIGKTDKAGFEKLVMSMPEGFMGSPFATGNTSSGSNSCSAGKAKLNDCPQGSKIGELEMGIKVAEGVPWEHVGGGIYMAPQNEVPAGKQARFWLVAELKAIAGGEPLALATDVIFNKESGYKVKAVTEKVPPEFDIRNMTIRLFGVSDNYQLHKPLLTLPTSCEKGQFAVTMFGETGKYESTTDDFTATDCGAQDFGPKANGYSLPPTPNSEVAFKTDLYQIPSGGLLKNLYLQQAHMKKAVVTLPKGFKVNYLAPDVSYCDPDVADDGECGKDGVPGAGHSIGTATAWSPVLSDVGGPGEYNGPLQGDVFLLDSPGPEDDYDPIKIAIFLKGITEVRVDGELYLNDEQRIEARFEAIPQLPVKQLELSLGAKQSQPKLIKTPVVECEAFPPGKSFQMDGSYWAHAKELNGKQDPATKEWTYDTPTTGSSLVNIVTKDGCGTPTDGKITPDLSVDAVSAFPDKGPYAAGTSPKLLHFTITREPEDEALKALKISLPTGMMGNPNSTEVKCKGVTTAQPADGCYSKSLVGKVNAEALMPGGKKIVAAGSIYNAKPTNGEPARLLTSIQMPDVAGGGELVLESKAAIRDSDKGVDMKITGIPTEFNITKLDIMLFGPTGKQFGRPFIVNPTQCQPGQIKLMMFGEYGASGTATDEYTATGCDKQPFKPVTHISLSPKKGNADVAAITTMNQQVTDKDKAEGYYQQAHMKEMKVTFPKGFTVNDKADVTFCREAVAEANQCGDPAVEGSGKPIGTVIAKSPLLLEQESEPGANDGPLTGEVYLIGENSSSTLDGKPLKMALFLDGLVELRIDGTVSTTPDFKLRASFPMYQLPVSEVVLNLGGDEGQPKLISTPCFGGAPQSPAAKEDYSAHAQEIEAIEGESGISINECDSPAPGSFNGAKLSVSTSSHRAGKHPGNVDIAIEKNPEDEKVNSFKLALPTGFIGNPQATSEKCDLEQAQAKVDEINQGQGGPAGEKAVCDPGTSVGAVKATVQVFNSKTVAAGGLIFNAKPASGQPGLLLTVIDLPELAGGGKLLLKAPVKLEDDGKGDKRIVTEVSGLPYEFNVIEMAMTLWGDKGAGGGRPFLVNPTQCRMGSFELDLQGQLNGKTAAPLAQGYKAEECANQPFGPQAQFKVKPAKGGAQAGLEAVISQEVSESDTAKGYYQQAHMKDIGVIFPHGFLANDKAKVDFCSPVDAKLERCGVPWIANSGKPVGTVEVRSPLLLDEPSEEGATDGPLSGEVYLIGDSGEELDGKPLKMALFLDGAVKLKVEGTVSMTPDLRLRASFPMYQLPVSEVALKLGTGKGQPKLIETVCDPGTVKYPIASGFRPHALELPNVASDFDLTIGSQCDKPVTGSINAASASISSQVGQAGKPTGELKIKVGKAAADDQLKSLKLTLPAGMAGNPLATRSADGKVVKCSLEEAKEAVDQANKDPLGFDGVICSKETQVGTVSAKADVFGKTVAASGKIYNAKPAPGKPAKLLTVVDLPEVASFGKLLLEGDVGLREGDYVVETLIPDLPQQFDLVDMEITLDGDRGKKFGTPFLVNPTQCQPGTMVAELEGPLAQKVKADAPYQATECGKQPFAPSLNLKLDPAKGNSDVSLTTQLNQPVSEVDKAAGYYQQAHMKELKLTFPKGYTVNDKADVSFCREAVADAEQCGDPNVAGSGKAVGAVIAKSPLLLEQESGPGANDGPLTGEAFLIGEDGSPTLDGKPLKMALFLDGLVKLRIDGTVSTTTDFRLQARFPLYQLPISQVKMELGTGEGQPKLVRTTCNTPQTAYWDGDFSAYANFAKYDKFVVQLDGCEKLEPGKFDAASLAISSDSKRAGISTGDLGITLQKGVDDDHIDKFNLALPTGMMGNPQATDVKCDPALAQMAVDEANQGPQAFAGSGKEVCPAASKVGSVKATVQVLGGKVVAAAGKLYNAKPEPSTPGLLLTVVDLPELAGGGKLLLKAPVKLEDDGAGDKRISTEVKGIPTEFNLTKMTISMDGEAGEEAGRPFLVNPTQCQPGKFELSLSGVNGGKTDMPLTQPHQATDCASQPFGPKAEFAVSPAKGGSQVALVTKIAQPVTDSDKEEGYYQQAHMKSIDVLFPKGFYMNDKAKVDFCAPAVSAKGDCGKQGVPGAGKPVASVVAKSPLLLDKPSEPGAADGPLKGYAYLVGSDSAELDGKPLEMAINLEGAVKLNVKGTVSMTPDLRLKASFPMYQLPLTEVVLGLGAEDQPRLIKTACNPEMTSYKVLTEFSPHTTKLPVFGTEFELVLDSECAAPEPASLSDVKTSVSSEHKQAGKTTGNLTVEIGKPAADDQITSIDIALPYGMMGNPQGTEAKCLPSEAKTAIDQANEDPLAFNGTVCPAGSEAGTVSAKADVFGKTIETKGKVYNAKPALGSGKPGKLLTVFDLPEVAGYGKLLLEGDVELQANDYRVVTRVPKLPEEFDVVQMSMTLHGSMGASKGKPFLVNPTQCQPGGFSITLKGAAGATAQTEAPYQATDCASQPFKPQSSVKLVEPKAFANIGTEVELVMPVTASDKQAGYNQQAHLKKTSFTYPKGYTVNDSAKVTFCSPAQADGWACPASTVVGTAKATSPLLLGQESEPGAKDGPMQGTVHLVGTDGDLEQGKPMKLSVFLDGIAKVRLDGELKTTADYRVKASFENSPQLAISSFTMKLGTEQGQPKLLRTPYVPNCPATDQLDASYTAHAGEKAPVAQGIPLTLTSNCGAPSPQQADFDSSDGVSFNSDGGQKAKPEAEGCSDDHPMCGFSPSASVNSSDHRAGASMDQLITTVTKDPDNFHIEGFKLALPEGMAGNPQATIEKCDPAEAQKLAGQGVAEPCPPKSKVGSVEIRVRVFFDKYLKTKGALYNASPQDGKPGLLLTAIKLPEIGGDGVLLLKSPVDATGPKKRIEATVSGIPAEFNATDIVMTMEGKTGSHKNTPFITNPTFCDPGNFQLDFTSMYSFFKSSATHPYQATECAALGFSPKLMAEADSYATNEVTRWRLSITQPSGQATMKETTITFPKAMQVNLKNKFGFCTAQQWSARQCPAGSRLGTMEVFSPLLPQASSLNGGIFFGQSGKVYMLLDGMVTLDLEGTLDLAKATNGIAVPVVNLPPLPMTEARVTVDPGLLKNPAKPGPGTFRADFKSHSSKLASSESKVDFGVTKLGGKAKLKVKLKPGKAKAYSDATFSFILPQDGQKPLKKLVVGFGKGKKRLKASAGRLAKLARKGGPAGKLATVELLTDSGKKIKAKAAFKGKALLFKVKGLKAMKLKLTKKGVALTRLPPKLALRTVRIKVKGGKAKLLQNPAKAVKVKFTAAATAFDGEKISAFKKIKIKKARGVVR